MINPLLNKERKSSNSKSFRDQEMHKDACQKRPAIQAQPGQAYGHNLSRLCAFVPCYENDSIINIQRLISFFGHDPLTCLKKILLFCSFVVKSGCLGLTTKALISIWSLNFYKFKDYDICSPTIIFYLGAQGIKHEIDLCTIQSYSNYSFDSDSDTVSLSRECRGMAGERKCALWAGGE